jgi:hypothetical protein
VQLPIDRVLDAVGNVSGRRPRRSGSGWQAPCPAHEDRNPSLSITVGEDDKVLLNCHGGCSTEAVVEAIGLTMNDLFVPRERDPLRDQAPQVVATYPYEDEEGTLLYEVVRYHPKGFRQRAPKQGGGWTWSLEGVRRVPYRLPKLTRQVKEGRWVLLVEGEKDVATAERLGFVATTTPMGAATPWRPEYTDHFRGAFVAIVPDADTPGRSYAEGVANQLRPVAKSVKVITLPDLPEKGDLSDWEANGGGADQLRQLVKETPPWTPPVEALRERTAWTAKELLETSWPEPRWAIPGLLPVGLTILAGASKVGKALAPDTPLPTPTGWVAIGEVREGDLLLDDQGRPTRVVAVRRWENRPRLAVRFKDGTSIVADEAHEWAVVDNKHGHPRGRIVETRDLLDNASSNGGRRYGIRLAAPLDLPEATLPVPPYTFGAWLGDGTRRDASITSADPEVLRAIEEDGYTVRFRPRSRYCYGVLGLHAQLRDSGLTEKRVPSLYLRASERQRRALLQGLMDTDGYAGQRGLVEFCSTDLPLAEAVYELAASLGLKPVHHEGRAALNGRDCGPKYRVTFTAYREDHVFRLPRKQAALPPRPHPPARSSIRKVVCVERVEPGPTVCVEVDSPSHLYLAGRAMVPTHNSWIALDWAVAVANGGYVLGRIPVVGGPVLYLALEDSPPRCTQRLYKVAGGPFSGAERLDVHTSWARTDEGGVEAIDQWLAAHRTARLVVVDVFAKVRSRGHTTSNGDRYALDYDAISPLKAVADKHGVAVLLLHHTRKLTADDTLERVSGTMGIPGASDTIMVLSRPRNEVKGQLFITGRDVEEDDRGLYWNDEICRWHLLPVHSLELKGRYPALAMVIKTIEDADRPMYPSEVATLTMKPQATVEGLLKRAVAKGALAQVPGDTERYWPLSQVPERGPTGAICEAPRHGIQACATDEEEEPEVNI